jgi:hypothetical protein
MNNSKKIIDRIKEQEIKPTPKWIFTLKNLSLWLVFGLSVIFGALAFSVILFVVQQADFNMMSHLDHSRMEMFLGLLPIIWLIFLILFFIISIFCIRNSWKGYKFSAIKQIGISFVLSMALGTLLFVLGGGQWIENAFKVNVATYQSLDERKQQMWSKPTEGYLSGKIISVNDKHIILKDFKQQEWTIEYTDSFISSMVMLEKDEVIKIIGKKKGKEAFSAKEIRPWGGHKNRPGIKRND